MKLFILSDTHDRLSKIGKLRESIMKYNPQIILHLGDIISPFFINQLFKDIKKESSIKRIIIVKGNNDGDCELIRNITEKLEIEFYLEYFSELLDNKRIFAIHKPDLVKQIAKSGEYDYIFYGHTHQKLKEKINSTYIINPGTASGYLAKSSTYVTLDLGKEEIEFHDLI